MQDLSLREEENAAATWHKMKTEFAKIHCIPIVAIGVYRRDDGREGFSISRNLSLSEGQVKAMLWELIQAMP